jgi:hypothetical protein
MKPEWAEAKGEKFDWQGSLIYGVSLASFMFGFSKLPSATGWILLGTGILLGLIFLLFEKGILKKPGDPVLHGKASFLLALTALRQEDWNNSVDLFQKLSLRTLPLLIIPSIILLWHFKKGGIWSCPWRPWIFS